MIPSKKKKRKKNCFVMGLFSNKVDRRDLEAGDHVYCWRTAYTYAHHGIYIGDNKIVHFTRGRGQELGTGTVLDVFLTSSVPPRGNLICLDCGFQRENSGVIISCLDCFLAGGPLYRFDYGTSPIVFLAKARGGTCTIAESDPPEIVVHRAMYLFQNGFGNYNIFHNNCEDFAIYCKTGLLTVEHNGLGRSGQAASLVGAPLAALLSSPLHFLMANPVGLATVTAGVYCLSRYATDIGVRVDVRKVEVEDLAVNLGRSSHALLPVAENSATQAASRDTSSINALEGSFVT